MKKIKFGSFPIVDIDAKERKCIDNYSIKSFADLITMNTQMRRTSNDIQQYITPDVILKYFKSNTVSDSPNKMLDNSEMNEKTYTIKRAYKALQNFSKVLEGNAFYKDRVTYPIYIEHENRNGSNDYDFILLSNDLIQKEILDEIKYDDSLSLTFLFIKDMLYPRVPLSKVGTSDGDATDSYHIRSDIAKFIEFSRNNNTDPISAMIKLIKIAGYRKKSGDTSYYGLNTMARQDKALNSSIGNKFFKLFGGDRQSGQIKDVNFLLNEINHLDIANFFDDNTIGNKTANNNQRSHTGYSGYKNTDDISSTLERQYIAQKTQDYNKILSMVDSLIHFNKTNDIMVDVDNAISDNTVRLRSAQNEVVEVDINYDKLIGSLRNEYFEAFLINLVQKLNSAQSKFLKDAGVFRNTGKSSYDPARTNSEDIEMNILEIQSIDRKLNNMRNGIGYSDVEWQNLNNDKRIIEARLMHLKQNEIFINQESYAAEREALKNKKLQSDLIYNVEAIQSELTGVLHDIESSLYDSAKIQKIFDLIGNRSVFTQDDLQDLFNKEGILKYNVEQLKVAIFESLQSTVIEASIVDNSDEQANRTSEEAERKTIAYMRGKQTEIEKYIENIIYSQMYLLFKRLGRDYGDNNLIQAQQYADLRAEKNTIIRKTITNNNNFKTYILNEKILLNLYEMLNYVDTQKYIAGLIAYPPAKINNELNIIKYMIKRLGLESNPVFIIGQQNVILSQPDFLSLTGSSVFSRIPFRELEAMCRINYNQTLWNNNQMFKQQNINQVRQTHSDYKKLFTDLQTQLKTQFNLHASATKAYLSLPKNDPNRSRARDDMNKQAEVYKKLVETHNRAKQNYDKIAMKLDNNLQDVSAGQEYGTSVYRQGNDPSLNVSGVKKYDPKDPQRLPGNKNDNRNQGYNKNNNRNQGYNPQKKFNPNTRRWE